MKIKVQVPTEESYYNEFGSKQWRQLNNLKVVKVNVLTGMDETEIKCIKTTGMTPYQYQNKFGRAWNE